MSHEQKGAWVFREGLNHCSRGQPLVVHRTDKRDEACYEITLSRNARLFYNGREQATQGCCNLLVPVIGYLVQDGFEVGIEVYAQEGIPDFG